MSIRKLINIMYLLKKRAVRDFPSPKSPTTTVYILGKQALSFSFSLVHLLFELSAFWFLEKKTLHKNGVSWTVLKIQLTRNNPTNAYTSQKWKLCWWKPSLVLSGSEIKCTLHVDLPKWPIHYLKQDPKKYKASNNSLLPLIYTVPITLMQPV